MNSCTASFSFAPRGIRDTHLPQPAGSRIQGTCVRLAKEADPEFGALLEKVMKQAQMLVPPYLRGNLGECHFLWREAKRILAQEHDVTWQSPAELNPDTIVD